MNTLPLTGKPETDPYFRHARHYLHVASNANNLCEKSQDVRDGITLFGAEWPNISCAGEWLAKRMDAQEEAARLCIGFMRSTRNYLHLAKRAQAMIPICTAALNAAVILKDRVNESLALSLLGEAHSQMDQHAESEAADLRCLAICEDTRDQFDADIASSLHNVAVSYVTRRRFQQADQLLTRALDISEKSLGSNHLKTGICILNLASLRSERALYAEAEPLFLRALSIFEQEAGSAHPRTATALHELALGYMRQGRHAEAESLLRRSVSIFENALGPDDADVAAALARLAEVRELRGGHREAEELYTRALAIYENRSADGQQVASALEGLGVLYYNLYRYEEAARLYRRSLSILERLFGPNDLRSLELVFNFAILDLERGEHAEAEAYFHRAVVGFESALGPDDPHTLKAKQGLAEFKRRFNPGREPRK